MSEVFDAGALTHLPVPQSDNAPAGWIPETYFSDSEISTFFLSALQAKQQDPAWYSDMSLKYKKYQRMNFTRTTFKNN